MPISIRNEQADIDISFIREAVNKLLNVLHLSEFELSILIVDNETITALNKKYLNKNIPTDVLAFSMQEGKESFRSEAKILGDVVISFEMARLRSKELEIDIKKEIILYLVHGVLHLLGYKDDDVSSRKEMERRQEELLGKIGY